MSGWFQAGLWGWLAGSALVVSENFYPGWTATVADLVFVGSMDWLPNVDGVLYFVSEVLPLIRNMAALTTMGVRPKEIFLQYMAKGTSNTRGRDLNIHIVHLPADGVQEPVIVGPDRSAARARIGGCGRQQATR